MLVPIPCGLLLPQKRCYISGCFPRLTAFLQNSACLLRVSQRTQHLGCTGANGTLSHRPPPSSATRPHGSTNRETSRHSERCQRPASWDRKHWPPLQVLVAPSMALRTLPPICTQRNAEHQAVKRSGPVLCAGSQLWGRCAHHAGYDRCYNLLWRHRGAPRRRRHRRRNERGIRSWCTRGALSAHTLRRRRHSCSACCPALSPHALLEPHDSAPCEKKLRPPSHP